MPCLLSPLQLYRNPFPVASKKGRGCSDAPDSPVTNRHVGPASRRIVSLRSAVAAAAAVLACRTSCPRARVDDNGFLLTAAGGRGRCQLHR